MESSAIAVFSYFFFKMPLLIGYGFGLTISPVATAMILPIHMMLLEKKLGTHKSIPQTLIPAEILDDKICIIVS